MALENYDKKRSFDKTPEPQGGKPLKNELRFVIQKHAATRLHYDFRLEMDGVLKSWAVPKGPSMDPAVKRLAVMVEDHPYDYRTFEGIIPKGQYGGGTVMVWDEGTYEPAEGATNDKAANEEKLLQELKKNKLKFVLKGEKLKGTFALVKAFGRGENSWLLMKMEDKFSSKTDVLKEDKSVVSGKDLDQIAATTDNIYGKTKRPKASKESSKQTDATLDKERNADESDPSPATADIPALLKNARKEKFPAFIKPMLATLVDEPFDDPDWEY